MRQGSLDSGIQALRVDLLHQLEPLDGRVLDRGPPDGARVVDEDIELAVDADRLVNKPVDLVDIARVDRDGGSLASGLADLALDRVDGRLRRVGVGREGDGFAGVRRGLCGDDDCRR